MFDVGQKVICVGNGPWVLSNPPLWRRILRMCDSSGPKEGSIWTIEGFEDDGYLFLAEWPGREDSFAPESFRPIVFNSLEALRSLLVSKKQTEKV